MIRERIGSTLLELIVALAILGVAVGLAGLAMRAEARPDPEAERSAVIARARREALESRRPVALTLTLPDGRALQARALPDGRVLADSGLAIDPLSGRPDAPR